MTEWKMVHGEGDDPLGPKTYVAEAYGVKFNPPLAQAEVGALIGKLGLAMREYVKTIVDANTKMRKAVPDDKTKKALAEKILLQIMENHREETGQTLVMVQGKVKLPPQRRSASANTKRWQRSTMLTMAQCQRGILIELCSESLKITCSDGKRRDGEEWNESDSQITRRRAD